MIKEKGFNVKILESKYRSVLLERKIVNTGSGFISTV